MLSVKAFSFNPVDENTYILYDEKGFCCIIDPGCYFDEERQKLRDFIDENQLKPVLLLNTHCHLDHVFGNKFVHDTWHLPLHIHPKEKQMLDIAPSTGDMWQMPFTNYEGDLVWLEEGSVIKIGRDELHVLFTPGHSPGHVIFYNKPGAFVIGGDVLFSGSIGRTDLPGGDFNTLINSIQTQLFTLPEDTRVFPGHGPETTIGYEKMHNPFVKLY